MSARRAWGAAASAAPAGRARGSRSPARARARSRPPRARSGREAHALAEPTTSQRVPPRASGRAPSSERRASPELEQRASCSGASAGGSSPSNTPTATVSASVLAPGCVMVDLHGRGTISSAAAIRSSPRVWVARARPADRSPLSRHRRDQPCLHGSSRGDRGSVHYHGRSAVHAQPPLEAPV